MIFFSRNFQLNISWIDDMNMQMSELMMWSPRIYLIYKILIYLFIFILCVCVCSNM